MKIKSIHEKICSDAYRIKVFGGWVVNVSSYSEKTEQESLSACFVPDKDHKWEIEK